MKYHIEFDLELKRNPYKGLYIALEGTEACGKTTQVEKLKEYFSSIGREVITTREPRKEGIVGDLVHQILLGKKDFPAKALQYLFTTDRVLNHEEVVLPALKTGKVVISDRVFWSGIVYGILDRMGEDYDTNAEDYLLIAHSILSFYHQFIAPDYTFYLKIPLDISLKRLANERKQSKEIYEDKEKIRKVIEGYN
ncbi:MAG: dTMP kinase, partial [Candidatus Levybacteria bacterium]|nr:dTMP kinase [Candidatus Levybacteria bacterium]